MPRRLVSCLLNVSEGVNKKLLEQIAEAATNMCKSSVVNVFSDQIYHRSVLTIVASVDDITSSIVSACRAAYSGIDLREHRGGHPRLGAVDLIPISPLSDQVTLTQCYQVARDIACRLRRDIPETSFFLIDGRHSDTDLVSRRKCMRWYDGQKTIDWLTAATKSDKTVELLSDDFIINSTISPKYGITGCGAVPYITTCNVTMKTDDLSIGSHVARAIRHSNPASDRSLVGCQSLALPREDGRVEIACNLQAVCRGSDTTRNVEGVSEFGAGRYAYTDPRHVMSVVEEVARSRWGVGVDETATVLGLTPHQALALGEAALVQGIPQYWRQLTHRFM